MDILALEDVTHHFGETRALDRISIGVEAGELVCLLGPSGCGKTTALRIAAGLETLQHGRVLLDGEVVADGEQDTPPEARSVGLVFQDYALFPHLTVTENVAFGLRSLPRRERRERAREVLKQVGMEGLADAHPHMLSGGQQQRVAVARALAPRPRVMLMDEPFSGLDVTLRHRVRDETLHVLKETGTATLMVTHDPEEAMFMADRVALMREGGIVQMGTPAQLYAAPATEFVASFFGDINRLQGVVREGRVTTPLGTLDAGRLPEGAQANVLVRPEAVRLHPASDDGGPGARTGRVLASRLLGRSSVVHLALDAAAGEAAEAPRHVHARVPGRFLPPENTRVEIDIDPQQAFVFAAQPDAA